MKIEELARQFHRSLGYNPAKWQEDRFLFISAMRLHLERLATPSEKMIAAGSKQSSYGGCDPAMVAAEVTSTYQAMLSAIDEKEVG